MIDFFDKLYYLRGKNLFYSFLRFSIRLITNLLVPLYLKLTAMNKKYSLNSRNLNNNKLLIVSLTSFPNRIHKLWIVIESILRQDLKPDRMILWLSKNQFRNVESLPSSLLSLKLRGLEIRLCDGDLRSHKKYYYAFDEFPNSTIITLDDDIFYSSKIISTLVGLSREYPYSICCNHASEITTNQGRILEYSDWKNEKKQFNCSNVHMPIGVGGILYPPDSLSKKALSKEVFIKHCFMADDIWLNMMARINGTKVSKSSYNSNYLPIMYWNNISLNSENVGKGLNDIQLKETRNYIINNWGIDPYKNLTNKNN